MTTYPTDEGYLRPNMLEYYEMDWGYSVEELPSWVEHVQSFISESLAAHFCHKHGHDLVDRSIGGPEHGNMDHECRTCGQYWSVPLY